MRNPMAAPNRFALNHSTVCDLRWGQVLDSLKTDFNMTAEEGISLFAVHALQGQQHNHRLPFQYMWIGNPHLTNVFFKVISKYHKIGNDQNARKQYVVVYLSNLLELESTGGTGATDCAPTTPPRSGTARATH